MKKKGHKNLIDYICNQSNITEHLKFKSIILLDKNYSFREIKNNIYNNINAF